MKTKRGFLLMNTGSPDEPSTEELQGFLAEVENQDLFDLPWAVQALLKKKKANHQPAQLTKAYQALWEGNESPMVRYSSQIVKKLREKADGPLELGMMYGHPSYKGAIEKLLNEEVEEICLLPMFPQYALATVGACVKCVKLELKRRKSNVDLRLVPPYFSESTYIEALAEPIRDTDEHILFNYHGYPVRHLKKADARHEHCMASLECCANCSMAHDTCYRFQCLRTSREIATAAGIPDGRYSTSFQSYADNEKWMEPHTHTKLQQLPAKGKKRIAVLCPSLLCDCLETLEEIEIRGKETFLGAGGESIRIIRSLNDSEAGIKCMESLVATADQWPYA